MTRTERAAYPRAIIRDRSSSRSGLDPSIRKNGAGGHNWGSIADERVLESSALQDEGMILEEDKVSNDIATTVEAAGNERRPEVQRANSNGPSDEEVQKARKYRKGALKGQNIDLAKIARTSAALSTSPPSPDSARRPGQGLNNADHSD
ncbi:hypothetical protein BDQ17DRAFT_1385211 [Cyathus striatus]|nr:hypothetical protein BDQ17DRAFT_1385211 [Cyathus striatus]